MPDPITCRYCICYARGYALAVGLCRELRAQHLCQKQVALRLQGQIETVIEGEYEAAAIRACGVEDE